MGTFQDHELTEEEKAEKKRKKKQRKQPFDGEAPQDPDSLETPQTDEDQEEVEEVEEDPNADPESYRMCSPQLLHLDLDGKPLWFNGWLLNNKFADKKQKKFGKFEHYLIEPRDVREPGAWQLEESNMCCLTTDPLLKRDFSKEEKAVLDMMVEQAKSVGVTG